MLLAKEEALEAAARHEAMAHGRRLSSDGGGARSARLCNRASVAAPSSPGFFGRPSARVYAGRCDTRCGVVATPPSEVDTTGRCSRRDSGNGVVSHEARGVQRTASVVAGGGYDVSANFLSIVRPSSVCFVSNETLARTRPPPSGRPPPTPSPFFSTLARRVRSGKRIVDTWQGRQ